MDVGGGPTVVVIVIPVLRRPHRAAPVLTSIREATPEPHRVVFVASPGDRAEHDAVRSAGGELLIIRERPGPGDYARKIHAGIAASNEPWIFTGADDLRFHPGWLPAALTHATPSVGVIGTNDLGSPRVVNGDHATHSLVARWYVELGTIDEPGKLLHEGYPHEWVDDELVATAKHRAAWAFARESHVEHLHPNWGKAALDPLYAAQRSRIRAGRRMFRDREHLWT
jgi:hypothetical protein